jgi:hypothetical protein
MGLPTTVAADRRDRNRTRGNGPPGPAEADDRAPLVVGYYSSAPWQDLAPETVPFETLTDVVYSEFRPSIELTEDGATVDVAPADPGEVAILGRLSKLASQHDTRVHVMAYDYHGPWVVDEDESPPTGKTGFNAPLYTPDDHEIGNIGSAADTMRDWADELREWDSPGSDPSDLLTMGLPFDGRHGAVRAEAYTTIAEQYLLDSDYERYWYGPASVPWLYSPEDRAFVTYDDPQSIRRKVAYALDNEFAGVMIWELPDDPSGELLGALDDEMWRTLSVDGRDTDSRTDYAFSVSGALDAHEGVDEEDTIDGSTATGITDAGIDRHRFTGDLLDYDLDGGDAVLRVDEASRRVARQDTHRSHDADDELLAMLPARPPPVLAVGVLGVERRRRGVDRVGATVGTPVAERVDGPLVGGLPVRTDADVGLHYCSPGGRYSSSVRRSRWNSPDPPSSAMASVARFAEPSSSDSAVL